ncbi:MAG: hypothetical protein Q8914_08330 [Bacteroidota bacterium]|nr:hypothetical protein [Bacteroidota bacterium]
MNIRRFPNSVSDYFNWLKIKISYQREYKKEWLSIGYMTQVQHVGLGKYNWTGDWIYLENKEAGNFSYFSDDCAILEATVGTNAVVMSDVGPYSIVGGVPASHLRYRFELEGIDFLRNIKWWDKRTELIDAHADLFEQ